MLTVIRDIPERAACDTVNRRVIQAAAITPRAEHGDLDFGATFELIDRLCSAGVGGIVLFDAAGEYAAFSGDERSRLVYLAVKRSRVPVIAGVGGDSLALSLALARDARQAGAAAVLLPPPYFFAYRQDDLREFYSQFARQLGGGVPVYIANRPAFTSTIEPETAAALLGTGHFAGIAEADAFDCIRAAGYNALGGDSNCEHALAAGAPVISAAACAVPRLAVDLDRAIAGNCEEEARRLQARFREFLAWVEEFPFPVLLKAAVELRGLKAGPPAVPLPPGKLRRMDEFREWFRAWDR